MPTNLIDSTSATLEGLDALDGQSVTPYTIWNVRDTTGTATSPAITARTGAAIAGSVAMRFVKNASAAANVDVVQSDVSIPVTAGTQYTFRADMKLPDAGGFCLVYVEWFTSGGGLLTASNGNSTFVGSVNPSTVFVTGVAPLTAALARVVVRVLSTLGANHQWIGDQFSMHEGASIDFPSTVTSVGPMVAVFDGVDDHITAPDSPALRSPTTQLTLAGWAWADTSGTQDFGFLCGKVWDPNGTDPFLSYGIFQYIGQEGIFQAQVAEGTPATRTLLDTQSAGATTNQWVFLALTADAAGGVGGNVGDVRLRMWGADGTALYDATTGNFSSIVHNTGELLFGANENLQEWKGRLARWGIHNGLLSDVQLESWRRTGRSPVVLSGGFWPFDGDAVDDYQGNVTTVNGATFVEDNTAPWAERYVFEVAVRDHEGAQTTQTVVVPVDEPDLVFFEDFTGTNGADWNTTRWPSSLRERTPTSADGVISIEGNKGRLLARNAAYAHAGATTGVSFDRVDNLFVTVTTASVTEQYIPISFMASAEHFVSPGVAGSGAPLNGYTLEYAVASSSVSLYKHASGVARATLGSFSLPAAVGSYRFQIQVIDGAIKVAGVSGTADPLNWNLEVTDTSFPSGRIGLGVYNGAAATAEFVDFDDLTVYGVAAEVAITLDAAASGSSATVGTANAVRTLTGVASGSSSSAGTATAQRTLQAVASGSSSSSGTAVAGKVFVAAASGASTSAGTATAVRTLRAVASGASTSSGTANLQAAQAATASGASTSAGTAVAEVKRVAVASGASVSSGTASATLSLRAAASGSSFSAGTAVAAATRVAVAAGSSSSAGTAVATVTRFAQASGSSTSSGTAAALIIATRFIPPDTILAVTNLPNGPVSNIRDSPSAPGSTALVAITPGATPTSIRVGFEPAGQLNAGTEQKFRILLTVRS